MRHNLPHWEQSGTTCFATFRLADSLPAGKLEELRDARARWLAVHPTPLSPDDAAEYHARFEETAERWLDAGHGECLLRASGARRAVEDAIRHFDGDRYTLHAFVVMPNHVHVLFTPAEDVAIGNILHSWKSFSAKTVNAALHRTGTVWEKESWDRFIRNRRHFVRTLAYIRSNPGKMDIPVHVAPAILEWLGDVPLGDVPLGDAASSRVPPTSHSPTRQDAASPNLASPNATPKRKSLP
jgi:REP element-mobilizing transposase RayT